MQFPVDQVIDELRAVLRRGHALLQAPTGSGKSTRVPLALLDEDWLAGRRILVLEPRRPAARLTASRMAAMRGEAPGETVGYQVRFDRRIGRRTRIEVLTEGILTRRLQSDPELRGVGAILFDELHEMNLQSELALTLTLDVVDNLRPDLRILGMSATLDAGPVAELLDGAPVLRGGERAFPVDVHYAPKAPDEDPVKSVAAAVQRALAEQGGDVLAFLPGAAEISRCTQQLSRLLDDEVLILPLHGSLPTHEQDLALTPGDGTRRRVVVATDIAETSVTIPGIGAVVDSGLARKPRFEPGSGLTRLETEPVSIASAEQRTGRAGRLGPGVCYRLWRRDQEAGRPKHRTAEILQSDLAPLALELALWGVTDTKSLKWLHPPPRPAWQQALGLLKELGAIDDSGLPTERGREMGALPVHPRLAAMLVGAARETRAAAADLCALLSERDPLVGTADSLRPADLDLRLEALRELRAGRGHAQMDQRRVRAADRVSRQLLQLASRSQGGIAASTGALLALAYPERVARRRDGSRTRYLLANGSGAVLPPDDPLCAHVYLVVADMDARGRDGRIRLALPIEEAELLNLFSQQVNRRQEVSWDPEREAVTARELCLLGAIPVAVRPAPLNDPQAVLRVLTEQIAGDMERTLDWSNEARQLQGRVALMRAQAPECEWPDLSTARLRATLPEWLGPWLDGMTNLRDVRRLDLSAILRSRLGWDLQRRLDSEAPARMTTPAGSTRRIDYGTGTSPVVAVPLQEMLGARETPTICGGRVKLVLKLLNPAQRPIQVTRDLPGFWAGSYAEVRKEMRGRYPKHHWPEDPINAQPMTRSVKRRDP